MNVLAFPCILELKTKCWYAGRSYPSMDALSAALDDEEWNRIVAWERRRFPQAAREECASGATRHEHHTRRFV
jgi:hypothetical protein